MVWAMDQKDQTQSSGLGSAPDVTPDQQANAQQSSNDQAASLSFYTTDCNAKCKSGTNKVAEVFGQPGQVSTRYNTLIAKLVKGNVLMLVTRDRCSSKQYRSVCCNDGTTMGKCQWRGYRGAGLSCIQGCADGKIETGRIRKEGRSNIVLGETEVVTDTSVQNGKKVGDPGTHHTSSADLPHLGSNLQWWSPVILLRWLFATTFQKTA